MQIRDFKSDLENIVVNRAGTATQKDYGFTVELNHDGSSYNPVDSVWMGQHQCVTDYFAPCDPAPENPSEVIIKHQLGGNRGHFSVLRQAFFVFNISGAPHETIAQLTRHESLDFLVQSGRYTGKRFIQVADGKLTPEEVFFHVPEGAYKDRSGAQFEVTKSDLKQYYAHCLETCHTYRHLVKERGYSYEVARSELPYNFRQDLQLSGTWRDIWHMLDQRTKADAQLSTRLIAHMIHKVLMQSFPAIQGHYEQHRLGKARLAP